MKQSSQRRHGRLGDGLVLLPGAAADADSAHDLAVVPQRHTACEDHDVSAVGGVYPVELLARARVGREVLGRDV